MQAGPAFVEQLQSAWDRGDAVLPLDPNAPRSNTDALIKAMRPAALVDDSGERHVLDGGVPIEEGDALVVMTSGTTGDPKGAIHTHRSVEYAAFMTSTAAHVDGDSCWLACLPLFHVGGLSVVTRALHSETRLMVHAGFHAEAFAEANLAGATHVSLVPTALGRVDPSRWRTILLGGSAIPEGRPANTIATYGMTETFGGVVYDGLALNGVEIRCVPGDSRETAPEATTIELRSPTLLRGYRSALDPRGTNALGPDGWYRTGDLGRFDPTTGILTVRGRADDLIITGGEKVWPQAVERVLLNDDRIAECLVVGEPDPEWGQRVVAMVVAQKGFTPPSLEDLRWLVRQHLPIAAAPKKMALVRSLERTALGKVRRTTARGGQSEQDHNE